MKILLFAILSLLSNLALADWEKVGTAQGTDFYLNSDMVVTKNHLLYFGSIIADQAKLIATITAIDCTNKKFATHSGIIVDKGGKLLNSDPPQNKMLWQVIPEDSFIGYAAIHFCPGQFKK